MTTDCLFRVFSKALNFFFPISKFSNWVFLLLKIAKITDLGFYLLTPQRERPEKMPYDTLSEKPTNQDPDAHFKVPWALNFIHLHLGKLIITTALASEQFFSLSFCNGGKLISGSSPIGVLSLICHYFVRFQFITEPQVELGRIVWGTDMEKIETKNGGFKSS